MYVPPLPTNSTVQSPLVMLVAFNPVICMHREVRLQYAGKGQILHTRFNPASLHYKGTIITFIPSKMLLNP